MTSGNSSGLTLAAVGDIHIDRVPPSDLMRHVQDELRAADVTFANSEQMFSDKGKPSPHHATFSHPRNVPALLDAGIDVVSLANNHTLDWGPEGLLDTIDRLGQAGIYPVGAGPDLKRARRSVIVNRADTRIGFLAYSCTGPDGYEATDNRAGYAPVRAWTVYDKIDYQPATPPKIVSMAHREDLNRMTEDIKRLSNECDVSVVSFHWGLHFVPRVIPDYCFEVGRAAIDAGADLVLGTHPHMLKGAERYGDRVIFYSTGNFAFEQGAGPEQHRGTSTAKKKFQEHYAFTPDPAYPTYPFHPEGLGTMIVKVRIIDKSISQVSFVPCFINTSAEPVPYRRGDDRGEEVFAYMKSISKSEGLDVDFVWDDAGREVLIT